MKSISVIYHVTTEADEIEKISSDITLEQTVEVPEQLVTSPEIQEQIVGKIKSISALPEFSGRYQVIIRFNLKLTGIQIPQLLNLVYGNISLKRNIKLIDIQLPDEYLKHFRGPNFGITGVRKLLGVYDRPLLSTALKPMGSSAEELAAIARDFSLGGGDIIKDDHGLIDETFEQFQERITLCQKAIEGANQKTGRRTLYFPNVVAPIDQVEKYVEAVLRQGITGILIAPFLVGLDCVRSLAAKYPIIIMAHPAFSGTHFHDRTHGMHPGILLGTIFRLIGSDISIFPNYGGRFSFTLDECRQISEHLQRPFGATNSAFPAPAGGMKLSNIDSMMQEYGEDVVLLIGGALLSHSSSLQKSTETFMDRIKKRFSERLEEPEELSLSACEFSGSEQAAQILKHLAFSEDFSWESREPASYKASKELPFHGITRFELTGKSGERCKFDLRYFQIEPDGYSSLEKHMHTHTVICVRGQGVLTLEGQRVILRPFDVAYVSPLEVHQLRNESSEPFGFFCIVDRERDRPMKP